MERSLLLYSYVIYHNIIMSTTAVQLVATIRIEYPTRTSKSVGVPQTWWRTQNKNGETCLEICLSQINDNHSCATTQKTIRSTNIGAKNLQIPTLSSSCVITRNEMMLIQQNALQKPSQCPSSSDCKLHEGRNYVTILGYHLKRPPAIKSKHMIRGTVTTKGYQPSRL